MLTRNLFLCLLCFSAFSCFEEIDMTITPPAGPDEVIDQEEPSSTANFKIGRNDATLTHGYVLTTPAADGETFRHHIVLSSQDVLDGDDLRSGNEVPTVAILVESASPSPVGDYPVTSSSFIDGAGSPIYNVSDGNYLLRNLNYDSGSSVTISADGDELVIEVDLLHNSIVHNTTKGLFTGPVLPLQLEIEEPEAIDPETFIGENFIKHGEETFELTNAYLVPENEAYRLYLSDRPVHNATELSGTSNVMLLFLSAESNGDLKPGRHEVGGNLFQEDGYFAAQRLGVRNIRSSYFCRNMNFDTNRADDDEPMDGGETLVSVDGDTFSIKFNFKSRRDNLVEGEFHGQILDAN